MSQALKQAGMKPADLAVAIGVSRATVSQWVNGPTKKLEGEHLTRAARALGVDAHWLATGEQRPGAANLDITGLMHAYSLAEHQFMQKYRALTDDDKSRALYIIDALLKRERIEAIEREK